MPQPTRTLLLSTSALVRETAQLLPPPVAGPAAGRWRWQVRHALEALRDHLSAPAHYPAALAARGGAEVRRRRELLARLGVLAQGLVSRLDTATAADELARLLTDVDHHLQRVRDLAWDDAGLDLGGSE